MFLEVLQEPWRLVLRKVVFQRHDRRARVHVKKDENREPRVSLGFTKASPFCSNVKLNSTKYLLFFFLWDNNFGGQGMILGVFSESSGSGA